MLLARDAIVVLNSEEEVRSLKPDIDLLRACPGLGIAVTAPGSEVDFVSRAFFPKVGIPEDPVTGATHCTLVPYWAARLGRNTLTAAQLSARGGTLYTKHLGDRVEIAGEAALYLEGRCFLPT